jgi:AcrR family transcriptional regulator
MTPGASSGTERNAQADRRARTMTALMAAGAKNISRCGYADLKLDRVASDAGYTRGALYHLFANKDALVLAVLEWVGSAWGDEVGFLLADTSDPVGTLINAARHSAIYSRNDQARVFSRLRPEFVGTNHPIEQAINDLTEGYVEAVARVITEGRAASVIPPGPPASVVARAYVGVLDGIVNYLGDHAPLDAHLAENAVLGVLGLPSAAEDSGGLTAFDTRIVVGQAQGILMERLNIDADRAFECLIRASRTQSVNLPAVAGWIITNRSSLSLSDFDFEADA